MFFELLCKIVKKMSSGDVARRCSTVLDVRCSMVLDGARRCSTLPEDIFSQILRTSSKNIQNTLNRKKSAKRT
jgi:hypothetical protein